MIIRLPWWLSEAFAASPNVVIVKWGLAPWLERVDVMHEGVHQLQMRRLPWPRTPRFFWGWLTDAEKRAAWEMEAFAVDVLEFRAHYGYGDVEEWVASFAKAYVSNKAYSRWRGGVPSLAHCTDLLRGYVEARNRET